MVLQEPSARRIEVTRPLDLTSPPHSLRKSFLEIFVEQPCAALATHRAQGCPCSSGEQSWTLAKPGTWSARVAPSHQRRVPSWLITPRASISPRRCCP